MSSAPRQQTYSLIMALYDSGAIRSVGFSAASSPTAVAHPLANYNFGVKDPKPEKDSTVQGRLLRMEKMYQEEGMRRSVDAALIVHEHNHPHLLLLQIGNAFFKLPGGRLKPGEDEVEGLKKKLDSKLSPVGTRTNWEIGPCVGTWYRPNFETLLYPYKVPHVTKQKEMKKIFLVKLPEHAVFAVPKNMKLFAIPMFELYDGTQRFGPIIASLPQCLSRFDLVLLGAKTEEEKERKE